MNKQLPKKLKKEPLLEALFEVRFQCKLMASTIIPGLLFTELEGNKKIEQLSTAQIPIAIRNADPNLQFAPVSRLIWERFHINIGDKSLSISCQAPYPGWIEFKKAIEKVIAVLKTKNIIETVDRYSIKYVNLIPSDRVEDQISLLNFDIAVANHKISKEAFQLRIEIPDENNLIHVISILSSAEVLLETSKKKGVIVDVDTIANIKNQPLNCIFEGLEDIRLSNKRKFFDCLRKETIDLLEPDYE